ncbi:MAG TPA: glutaredoxin family protein [Candidatus Fermentibacter sp.]|nr:glutaredoxin family protein [Candidatus Fermentibacter sp.]
MSAFPARVEGRDAGDVLLYALSTCVWCRRARQYLDSLGVAYSYIYVDLLEPAEMDGAVEAMAAFNPRRSFPTIVIGGARVITGFDEKALREALG